MLSAVACMPSFGSTSQLTDYEFSAVQELLVVATGEGNSSIRAWCGQKHAEDSRAQPDTPCRGVQGFLARVLLLHCWGMEQLCPPPARRERDLYNVQPVISILLIPHRIADRKCQALDGLHHADNR